jgi:Xaa-Pro aminopeptidase
MPMYEGLREAFPEAEIANADPVMTELRQIKSPAELACLRAGLKIAQIAMKDVLKAIRPGVTERELVGVVCQSLLANGAESEAVPSYVFSGSKTRNAISRTTDRKVQVGDMMELNFGGRVDGYSPCIGRPICVGKMTSRQRDLVTFARDMHFKTYEWTQAGTVAADVAKKYEATVHEAGYGECYLYGPCHGLGMIEVEKPWMESISNYELQPNMTFQADTFFADKDFGLRWENGLRVTESGSAEMLGERDYLDIVELDF